MRIKVLIKPNSLIVNQRPTRIGMWFRTLEKVDERISSISFLDLLMQKTRTAKVGTFSEVSMVEME